jgi:hypothetical protein
LFCSSDGKFTFVSSDILEGFVLLWCFVQPIALHRWPAHASGALWWRVRSQPPRQNRSANLACAQSATRVGHVAAGFGNNNLSRNEPTVRGTRIKDHGIRFSRLAGSAILGGLLVFLKVMTMRALIMRRWIRGWILSISDWMKNMALEIDDLRQSINRENQNIK